MIVIVVRMVVVLGIVLYILIGRSDNMLVLVIVVVVVLVIGILLHIYTTMVVAGFVEVVLVLCIVLYI